MSDPPTTGEEEREYQRQLREVNEALLVSSVRQHELTEQAQKAERAARESEERFRMLADAISQFAWTADAKGRINWYNRRWYDYTGTTLEQMQGLGSKAVHHPDHVDRVVQRMQRSWDTGEPWEDTFPLRGKDGDYRWFLSRALPIRDEQGNILRWFGTNTDVTEQREMADKIAQQAEQLADESRRKDEFLAMLSHELRNPWPQSAPRFIFLSCRSAAARMQSSRRPARSLSAKSTTSRDWSPICWMSRASSAAEYTSTRLP